MSTKKNLEMELFKLQEEIELLTLENEKQILKIKSDIKNKKKELKELDFIKDKNKIEILSLEKTRKLPKKDLEILTLEKTKELNLLKLSNTKKFTTDEIKYLELEMNQQVEKEKLAKDLNINNEKLDNKIDNLIKDNKLDKNTININNKITKKRKGIPKYVYIVILIISFFSLFFITKTLLDRRNNDIDTKKQIDEIIKETNITIDDSKNTEKEPEDDYHRFIHTPLISVDFDTLKKRNPDTIGWVQVSGTNVNYPFVQADDNDYYLNHSFDKSNNTMGWVFLDYRNNINKLDNNTILYAHGLYNNTMFGSLKQVIEPSWYKNSDNHKIRISTEKANSLWQIFSTYTIEPEVYYLTNNFDTTKEYNDFIETMKSRSVYNYDIDLNTNDKILTLSSCYNDNLRVVVHAKLIKTRLRNN